MKPSLHFCGASLIFAACVACSGTHSPPSTPILATATPAPEPTVTATPSPAPTMTPTPAPTITPGPISGSCSFEPAGATYTSFVTTGVVQGNRYTEDVSGVNTYSVEFYVLEATPSPVPTAIGATPTPVPTASPTASPSPRPTPTPQMVTDYFGSYVVPGFTGSANGSSFTASPTSGCFTLELGQRLGGTAGQVRSAAADNAHGTGVVYTGVPGTQLPVAGGTISHFEITMITRTTGTGTFTLSSGVSGTVTIVGSEPGPGRSATPSLRR